MPRKAARRSFDLPQFHSTAPPTPPESIKDFRTDTITTLVNETDKLPPRTSSLSSPSERLLDRLLRLIGAVCAITFGIWAPLSYKLQKDGNKSNDAAQDDLRKEVKGLRAEMRLLSALKAFELCSDASHKETDACKDLGANAQLHNLMRQFVSSEDTSKASPSAQLDSGRREPSASSPEQSTDPEADIATTTRDLGQPSSVLVDITTTPTQTRQGANSHRPETTLGGCSENCGSDFTTPTYLRPLTTSSGFKSIMIGYMDGLSTSWSSTYLGNGDGVGYNQQVLSLPSTNYSAPRIDAEIAKLWVVGPPTCGNLDGSCGEWVNKVGMYGVLALMVYVVYTRNKMDTVKEGKTRELGMSVREVVGKTIVYVVLCGSWYMFLNVCVLPRTYHV
ncbi:hypothetical protein CC80DRAFT_489596 [Byssothecium circinans]|uniref:Uncharacterized protein n=1 Tax=Byssothecium circinans TaxID=147558 RepID=A0A6A5U9F8_9PLEO|nr:hypothetical protein CC80DRAFT_489596 [Byssothecium circinans]